MTPESLFEQFDVIAETPNGVHHLRELVLQLAVRGKLVLQDRRDEPVSVLLERIATEAGRPLSPIAPEDAPHDTPDEWRWVRIGDAMNLVNGRAFKPAEWSGGGTPIVRIQNLNNSAAPFNYCAFDVPEKFYIEDEDLLLSWSGTPGTSFGAFVWRRGRAVLNQHIFRCDIRADAFFNDFARIAINARLDEMIAQAHGGVGLQHVTKGKLDRLAIVLPPLAEQRRIVAKVNELIALCDNLESRLTRASDKAAHLAASFVHHLGAA